MSNVIEDSENGKVLEGLRPNDVLIWAMMVTSNALNLRAFGVTS